MKILLCDYLDLRGVRAALTRAFNEAPVLDRLVTGINAALGDAKSEWTVLPYGVYPNEVGLQVFDRESAQAIHTAFNSKLNQLANAFRGEPIYPGHPDDPAWRRANPGHRMEAVGRLRETKVGEDGLHLKFAYNDEGQRLVGGEAPAYTCYSPVWGMKPMTYKGRQAYRPMQIYSIGLTNTPQIPGTFIGLNEALPPETSNPAMKLKLIALLAALGRPIANADAVTDEQLALAANEALPVATKLVTDAGALVTATNEKGTLQTQLTAAQGQLTTATNETATLRTQLAAERAARAGAVITIAINEGRITEAGRAEWLGKFTAKDADFGAVEGDLGKLKKAINTKSKTDLGARRQQSANNGKITAINEAITAKCKVLGTEDRTVAYNALVREGHELFKNNVAAE